MLISKELEGATVQRVYWGVPSREWLPVVGEKFDSHREAADHADKLMEASGQEKLAITSRIVLRKTDGVAVDMEVAREYRFRVTKNRIAHRLALPMRMR